MLAATITNLIRSRQKTTTHSQHLPSLFGKATATKIPTEQLPQPLRNYRRSPSQIYLWLQNQSNFPARLMRKPLSLNPSRETLKATGERLALPLMVLSQRPSQRSTAGALITDFKERQEAATSHSTAAMSHALVRGKGSKVRLVVEAMRMDEFNALLFNGYIQAVGPEGEVGWTHIRPRHTSPPRHSSVLRTH